MKHCVPSAFCPHFITQKIDCVAQTFVHKMQHEALECGRVVLLNPAQAHLLRFPNAVGDQCSSIISITLVITTLIYALTKSMLLVDKVASREFVGSFGRLGGVTVSPELVWAVQIHSNLPKCILTRVWIKNGLYYYLPISSADIHSITKKTTQIFPWSFCHDMCVCVSLCVCVGSSLYVQNQSVCLAHRGSWLIVEDSPTSWTQDQVGYKSSALLYIFTPLFLLCGAHLVSFPSSLPWVKNITLLCVLVRPMCSMFELCRGSSVLSHENLQQSQYLVIAMIERLFWNVKVLHLWYNYCIIFLLTVALPDESFSGNLGLSLIFDLVPLVVVNIW